MAAAPGPTIVDGLAAPLLTREEWGAEPAVDWPVEHARLRAIVVHHTGRTSDGPDPVSRLRRVQRFHAVERGWGDIGYSFVILEDGRVAEGRTASAAAPAPLAAVAGHAYGHNPGTLGVALAGRFHEETPTPEAWSSLLDLVVTVSRTCGLDPAGPVTLDNGRSLPDVICGHRHARDTPCPGDALAAALPSLRAEARAALQADPDARLSRLAEDGLGQA